MKRIKLIFSILAIGLIFTSCDEFLTYDPSDAVGAKTAFKTAKDVENGMNGIYYSLGRYQFYGRNVVALGDIAADNCFMTGESGHFDAIYKYTITESSADLLDIYEYGYKVINSSAKLIKAGKGLLNSEITKNEGEIIKASLAQAYGVKALSHLALVNIFGLPYSNENASSLGIVNIGDEPVIAFQEVERNTVAEVYKQIKNDIDSAKQYISFVADDSFIMNEVALHALEARVNLYMKDYEGAKAAANAVITEFKGEIVKDSATYVDMWSSIAASDEDIFTIAKTNNDNLSANSLNTLYGSYNGKATSGLVDLFQKGDMRNGLFEREGALRALKYKGMKDSEATSNIPVFRLPEMYLILAEAKAQLGDADAVDAIYEIAKRNPNLEKSEIPTTKTDLLNFISVERRRELFQEGHRWFDMRRTGEIMTRVGGIYGIENWNISKFVYPIPARELNSEGSKGVKQNDGWHKNLPKSAK